MGKLALVGKRILLIASLITCGFLAVSQGVSAGTTQPGPEFVISDLVVPAEAGIGEKIAITITITNKAGTDGDYEGTLTINGVEEATKVINVPPKTTKQLSFTVSRSTVGSYEVVVGKSEKEGGLKGSFTVVDKGPAPSGFPTLPVVGGIIGAVVIVALAVFLLVRRKPAKVQSGS